MPEPSTTSIPDPDLERDARRLLDSEYRRRRLAGERGCDWPDARDKLRLAFALKAACREPWATSTDELISWALRRSG